MNNRKRSLFAASMMLMTALLGAITMIPSASAHPCTANDPETACQECGNDIIAHDHRYSDGRVYCESPGCEFHDVLCIASAILEGE